MHPELNFHRFSNLAPNAFAFRPRQLVVAGWTARDREGMERYMRELEAQGIKRPSTMPLYYRVAAGRLTQDTEIQVLGAHTSGEVEPVLFSMRDGLWLGVGSDHTDRKLESHSVASSKQICPKVISGSLWDCRELAGHWDELILRAYITEGSGGDRVLYQEGSLQELLPPAELITGYAGWAGLPVGTVMYCGTLAARGGMRPSSRFEMELEDPVLKRSLTHAYSIEALPVVE
jgi:hypothetical protein